MLKITIIFGSYYSFKAFLDISKKREQLKKKSFINFLKINHNQEQQYSLNPYNTILQELACDGVTDCSNGRDEDGCLSIYPESTDIRNFKPAYSDLTGWLEYL